MIILMQKQVIYCKQDSTSKDSLIMHEQKQLERTICGIQQTTNATQRTAMRRANASSSGVDTL